MARPVKFLVLQFASIGDVVLTTPIVRCLKQQIPNATVHFCTRPDYELIVGSNPNLTKNHYLDGSLIGLIRELRAERFDYVIDLQNTIITNLIRAALGCRSYRVKRQTLRQWLYTRWKINAMSENHIVDQHLAVVQPLGVEDDGFGLDYFIPYKDEVETDWLPETHRQNYVAFVIGGRSLTRRLPTLRIIELCLKIDYPIILLGDKADRKTGEEVVRAIGSGQIFNACGQFNLNQSASLLQRARVVFSHDTGLMHIASAFRRKVYSIWGSSTPHFGYYPYRTPHMRLETPGLGCRPCSVGNTGSCPMKHFKCMNNLSFDFEVRELRVRKFE